MQYHESIKVVSQTDHRHPLGPKWLLFHAFFEKCAIGGVRGHDATSVISSPQNPSHFGCSPARFSQLVWSIQTLLDRCSIPKNSTGIPRANTRIIGGEPITSGESPFNPSWIVYIEPVGCGGSWINPHTIITAAHCFDTMNEKYDLYSKSTNGGRTYLTSFMDYHIYNHD